MVQIKEINQSVLKLWDASKTVIRGTFIIRGKSPKVNILGFSLRKSKQKRSDIRAKKNEETVKKYQKNLLRFNY